MKHKNKNIILKTCLSSLFLSISGLAAADTVALLSSTTENNDYKTYAGVAGAGMSVAAGSQINGHLAAQAALVIGADTQAQNAYAGAAVSTGAGSVVTNIYAGAAATIAANAIATKVVAGAAITAGGGAFADDFYAGAAITLGGGTQQRSYDKTSHVYAGAAYTGTLITKEEGEVEYQKSAGGLEAHINALKNGKASFDMATALNDIDAAYAALSSLTKTEDSNVQAYTLGTSVGVATGPTTLMPGVYQGGAVNMPADTVITFNAGSNGHGGYNNNQVWIINLTDALTLGAGTSFDMSKAGDNATIIWNVGGAVNLGAGTEFIGITIVKGAVTGATASLSCGNLYAKGAVSIGSIGSVNQYGEGMKCTQSAAKINSFSITTDDQNTVAEITKNQ